ncbi:MAG: aldehyde dehydrogenase family protein [Phycisphaerae bacterium]
MTQVDDQLVREMVQNVLQRVQTGWGGRIPPTSGKAVAAPVTPDGTRFAPPSTNKFGQFTDVNEAVEAATCAQRALMRRSLAQREIACDLIRQICIKQADRLGEMEYEETRIGHRPHKAEKLVLVGQIALGVEFMRTECFSGDHGITLEEHGPWGVIGVITPVTHSLPTLANNAVNMIAAGNSLVCNPHPSGKRIAAYGAQLFNQAIYEKLGIDNLICVITEPTIESAQEIFKHPDVRLLSITGGPGVVAAAMKSGKRAICAGPGNPPCVVDASADIQNAAHCIYEGAVYDNNLLCISEKEVYVVAEVWDAVISAMEAVGAFRLSPQQMDQLGRLCIQPGADGGHPHANRQFVGAEPQVLAEQIGVTVPPACRMLFGQTEPDHPFVQAEQMMPVIPFIRCPDFEQAVEYAQQAEHGFGHTAVIHSRLVDHMTYMGKAMDTTIFVKNGPSVAGDGSGGEGYGSYSIACSTGEGIATPLTYTRLRRCVMVDNLRII